MPSGPPANGPQLEKFIDRLDGAHMNPAAPVNFGGVDYIVDNHNVQPMVEGQVPPSDDIDLSEAESVEGDNAMIISRHEAAIRRFCLMNEPTLIKLGLVPNKGHCLKWVNPATLLTVAKGLKLAYNYVQSGDASKKLKRGIDAWKKSKGKKGIVRVLKTAQAVLDDPKEPIQKKQKALEDVKQVEKEIEREAKEETKDTKVVELGNVEEITIGDRNFVMYDLAKNQKQNKSLLARVISAAKSAGWTEQQSMELLDYLPPDNEAIMKFAKNRIEKLYAPSE